MEMLIKRGHGMVLINVQFGEVDESLWSRPRLNATL
jgi:hypothetical protein